MVWGLAWLSKAPGTPPSSKLLRLLRLRLLSMEVMLEEEAVRERARRVIPTVGTKKRGGETRVNVSDSGVQRANMHINNRGGSHAKRFSKTEADKKRKKKKNCTCVNC